MTLDSILNWGMPILVVLFFVGVFYMKLKEPADKFLRWIGNGIKNLISGGAESAKETVLNTEITYGEFN